MAEDYFDRRRAAVVKATAVAIARRRVTIVFCMLLALAMLALAIGAMVDAAAVGNSFGIMTGVASVFALIGVASALVGVVRAYRGTRTPYPSVLRARPSEGRWPITAVGATSMGLVFLGLGGALALVFWGQSPAMALASLAAAGILGLIAPFSYRQFRASPGLVQHYLENDPEFARGVEESDPAWF